MPIFSIYTRIILPEEVRYMNTNSVPTEAISIYNKALERTNRGDLSTALSEYQKAVKMYPFFIEAYNNMGEIYSIMGERELAISIYNKALNIEKNHKILLNLGVVYYNSGNYKLALGYFLDSLKEKNNFQEGHYYTGLTYYNLKDFKEAEKYLSVVIKEDKKHLKANYILSHIYYEWKDYSRVIECLEAIKDKSEDQGFINKYYGFCCYHLGRYDEAVKYLKAQTAALAGGDAMHAQGSQPGTVFHRSSSPFLRSNAGEGARAEWRGPSVNICING